MDDFICAFSTLQQTVLRDMNSAVIRQRTADMRQIKMTGTTDSVACKTTQAATGLRQTVTLNSSSLEQSDHRRKSFATRFRRA